MRFETRLFTFATAAAACILCISAVHAAEPAELPFGMRTSHLNLVLSVSDAEKTHEFYGEILGLKRIPNIDFPDDVYMIRYMGGTSEIKFIVTGEDLPSHAGKTGDGIGIRLMAVLLPDSKRTGVLEGLEAHGYPTPTFTEGKGFRYGMAFDADGNQVEVVFIDEGRDEALFNIFQIGLTVSDTDAMNTFLREILGLVELPSEPIGGGNTKYSYKVGDSTIKFWSFGPDLPLYVGSPFEKIGMNLVQFLVPDVDAVRKTVLERGGKIHTEPFALGKLATIMFVEGPDGILFEFAGPLLEHFKE